MPPQSLDLSLDVDRSALSPQQLVDPYSFVIGEQIPLMAQIAATGQENIHDTVQIELTVPRGLRPTGMTIQGEDQTLLDVIFSLLLELLTQLDPDLSGLVNDLLGIDVGEEQITFVYDYDRDLVIGQPFPITLDVVGEVTGEFTVTGQALIESGTVLSTTPEPLALMSPSMSGASSTSASVSFQVVDLPTQPTPPSQNCTPSSSPRCNTATELEAYGVWVVDLNEPETVGAGYWTDGELNELLTAVQNTALAFSQFSSQTYATNQDAFKAILLYNLTDRIEFIQRNDMENTCATTARTPQDVATGAARAVVSCGGNNVFTQYTATHELGHVFLNQTANDEPVIGATPPPCLPFLDCMENPIPGIPGSSLGTNRFFVFGLRGRRWNRAELQIIINREGASDVTPEQFGPFNDRDPINNPNGDDRTINGLTDWERGDRGWGSGAPNPGACGASTGPIPTNFQQNPCIIIGWLADASATVYGGEDATLLKVTEVEEAGADMFLNWIYKSLGLGGFEDKDWSTNADDNLSILNGTGPGADRQNWTNQQMSEFFLYYGW